MKIIYVHGLDSSAQSVKGLLLEEYCKTYNQNIEVYRPDLNIPPNKVFNLLCQEIKRGKRDSTVLVGSSLGGYFSSIVSNFTGCTAVLLNPSTQPHVSLKRFLDSQSLPYDLDSVSIENKSYKESIIYQTTGGWNLTYADLQWFNEHKLESIEHPNRVLALIKKGDELLDSSIAIEFYRTQGSKVIVQEGGDHRMTDFADQIPLILECLPTLL